MYIQEIIIDGFKSYAQKTVVSGFDPQFNAITGLNGTGKSNILDSICFVLGISNLSQVRVGNLQELVYKQGQAGVTKATVSIVFNNSDVAGSPVGYESHKQITVTRQVVIGGKNKYMINGHTVQQNQVQTMFHSVQLNVNNPHFLIMQGRITKVLNMKPAEILSMIEEAAGTRIFETKKLAAIKTIEKKQLKVDEITKCIDEDITPTLESLRKERKDYHAWQANNTEFERLERFCIAFDFCTAEEKVKNSEKDKQNINQQIEHFTKTQDENNTAAESCAVKISEIIRQRDSEAEGDLKNLKKQESEVSKDVVKTNTLFSNQQESIASEEENLSSINTQISTIDSNLQNFNTDIEKSNETLVQLEEKAETAEKNYVSLRESYQNAVAGVADDSNAEMLSLPEQVASLEKKERESLSQVQQCQQKITHTKDLLKELKKSSKTQGKENAETIAESEALQKIITGLEEKLNSLNFDESLENTLQARAGELRSSIAELGDKVDRLSAGLEARLQFQFQDPERGFDRSKVKGLVARLVQVKDDRSATALEVTAGSRLYQVVVDTEQTGKQLLQKGGLRKRVTILPLNKLQSRCVDPKKVKLAKEVARASGASAFLALELVGFEEEVRGAMEYVFGGAIVCDTVQAARTIAFDPSLKVRTVTLQGDTYDPAGTLTGGSKSQIGALLGQVQQLGLMRAELEQQMGESREVNKRLSEITKQAVQVKGVTSELALKRHAFQLCQAKIADSSYAQCVKQIEENEAKLAQLEEDMASHKEQHGQAQKELKELKSTHLNAEQQREKAIKDMEAKVKSAQKASSAAKSNSIAQRSRLDGLKAEVSASASELKGLEEQRKVCLKTLATLKKENDVLGKKLDKLREEYDEIKEKVNEKTQELNRCSSEIKSLEKEKEKHLKEAQNASLEGRKLAHKLKQWEKDSKDAEKYVSVLLKQYPWIEKEKEFFGQEGSDFHFASKNIAESVERRKELKAAQERLGKKINKKVMGMIENAESEYQELNRKRQVILNDKEKIEAVIDELDVKKIQTLQTTWEKVNRDFGSIFSMLLPGTTAKLDPPENDDVSSGLEVKVAFNGVWKESLTELSGGQRSLLALSLILSLLLFKPAPMYILDEVDAALDLSHTQNIGMMLRTHFSNSQFIVVSLKEGMFNNANVIFRTRFVDGISAVTRTVVGSARGARAPVLALQADEEAQPPKKKGKGGNKKANVNVENELII